MKKAVQMFTACCLALGITLAGTGISANAQKNTPVAGLGSGAEKGTETSEEKETEALTPLQMLPPQVVAPVEKNNNSDADSEKAEAAQKEAETKKNAKTAETEKAEDVDDGDLGSLEEAAAKLTSETPDQKKADTKKKNTKKTKKAETKKTETASETEVKVDTSMKGALGFAVCENEYVNVRNGAGVDYEVLGKLTNHDSVTILAKVEDWYLILSGNLSGFVKDDYIAVGAQAETIADETAYNVAKVNAEALMIRTAPDENSESMGMASQAEELEVVAREGDWMKVALGGDSYGYVNGNYVETATYYPTGETLQEESERLDREWLAYLAQQEAKRRAEEAAWLAYLAQQEAQQRAQEAAYAEYVRQQEAAYAAYVQQQAAAQTSQPANYSVSVHTSEQAAADAAYQTYLDAQAAADAATTGTDEQAVYDTAAAAQEAYASYLSAQSAADTAAVAAAYTDTTYTEPTYTEASYSEPSYSEPSVSDGSAQSAADAAYQNYLDAQAAADAATTGTDEQAVYDTADAAEKAYEEYLSAQYLADLESVGSYTEETYSEDSGSEASYSEETYSEESSSLPVVSDGSAQSDADAAYQAYLDAQAKADAATTGTDEQAVYDTAEAAEQAYSEYLRVQAIADEAAINGTAQPAQESSDGTGAGSADNDAVYDTTDDTYDDEIGYVEDSGEYVEDSYTGDSYAEETYSEPVYVEEAAPAAAESAPSYSSTGSSIVDFATQYVGNPYVYGGTSLTGGADCSGFVQTVFSNFGISLPRTAAEQSYGGTEVSMSDLQPGDLLFYNGSGGIGHVTIYMGNGQVVHASNPTNGIVVSDIGYRTPAFAKRYT